MEGVLLTKPRTTPGCNTCRCECCRMVRSDGQAQGVLSLHTLFQLQPGVQSARLPLLSSQFFGCPRECVVVLSLHYISAAAWCPECPASFAVLSVLWLSEGVRGGLFSPCPHQCHRFPPRKAAQYDKATGHNATGHNTCRWGFHRRTEPGADGVETRGGFITGEWLPGSLQQLHHVQRAHALLPLCACTTHSPEESLQLGATGGGRARGQAAHPWPARVSDPNRCMRISASLQATTPGR